MIQWIETAAFLAGVVLSVLLAILPRFGPGSRHLILLILPASLSAAVRSLGTILADLSPQDCARISFALILIAAGGGYVTCCALKRETNRRSTVPIPILQLLLFVLICVLTPPYSKGVLAPQGYIPLGPIADFSALILLIISVIILANLEQILRNAAETVRWELKFLLLGMAVLFAALIYLSSKVLLFMPGKGLLLESSLGLFHSIFLFSCVLIAVSWKRSTGRAQIAVSHGAIYSSITLLCVGIYLIASSITSSMLARLADRWGEIGLPTEPLLFLLSAVLLLAFILGTRFRQRAKAWIRRNIFSGAYDYRQFWLESTERVRSIDPTLTTAEALADMVHRALGAIDISVWLRRWNPNCLCLLSSQGTISDSLPKEISGVVEELLNVSEPLSKDDLAEMRDATKIKHFANITHASLVVPLVSSNRVVGVVTVGSDRSGHDYGLEAREFLRALAGHAAGEFHKSDLLATLVAAKEDEAFRTFSTFLLHDLKNFASTLSYVAQNAPRHQNNPDFQKDVFQSVYDIAEKMKRLCNSLRTFSSTIASNKKLDDLNQIVRSVADSLNAGVSKPAKLDLEDLPPVLVDSDEMKRVIQNLLLNAREAILDDGAIIVRTRNLADKVELSVQDNGKGMTREFFENELFLPFHTTKSGGLGIGLFQSKKIIEAHGGSIVIASESGKGTVVRVMLPVAKINEPISLTQSHE